MKLSTSAKLARMHIAQVNWAKAKAYYETIQDEVKAKWKDNTIQDEDCRKENDALKLFREATAGLLEFGRAYHTLAAKKHASPLDEATINKMFGDRLCNYCMVDLLPDWWQSKLVKLLMNVNAKEVGL